MAGEMIYILDQRLSAQAVGEQKSAKVINEIVGSMFSAKFTEEMFHPKEIYPKKLVRHIFEKVAHSSIMRLNESSMEKLYDLMIMTAKYQIILCPRAADMLKVTYNHVSNMRKLVRSSTVLDLLDKAFITFNQNYSRLTDCEWTLIRSTVLYFFQDIHIRVSIFLRENLQTQQGALIIKTNGIVPTGFQQPGEIQTFRKGRLLSTHTFDAGERYEPADDKRLFELGSNIFSKSKNSDEPLLGNNAVRQTTSMVNATSDIEMLHPDPNMVAQLNLLSSLIGNNANNDSSRSSNLMKLSLFDDDDDDDMATTAQSRSKASKVAETAKVPRNEDITIDASKRGQNARLSHVLQDFDFDERPRQKGKGKATTTYDDDDDEDLCSMMDRLPSNENKRR